MSTHYWKPKDYRVYALGLIPTRANCKGSVGTCPQNEFHGMTLRLAYLNLIQGQQARLCFAPVYLSCMAAHDTNILERTV